MRVGLRRIGAGLVAIGLGLPPATASSAESSEPGRIAYLARTDGYWQAWTMTPDGDNQRQVTRSPYEKTRVSWFPDGRALLVNSLSGHVYRVEVDSGRETRIPLPLEGTVDAVLSGDGRQIAFSQSVADSQDDNEIFVVDLDGTDLRRLTTMAWLQHDPAWSEDGRWIYFMSGNGDQAHDILRVAVETGEREQLTVGSLYHFELAIASDGRLAFSSNRSGNYEIWTWRRQDGAEPSRLTHHPALDGRPTWSPDRKSLLFHSTRGGGLNIWRIAADGGEPSQLTWRTEGAREPVWWQGREPDQEGRTP